MRPPRWFVSAALLAAAGCAEKAPTADIVPLDKLPAPVMATAKEKLPGVKFETAWKTADGDYEVRGKEANGRTRDVCVKPTGEVVEVD